MAQPERRDTVADRGQRMDDALEALASAYRRRLLVALLDHNPQDDDDQTPVEMTVSDTQSDLLQAEMVHKHLPKLDDLGFIAWDREADEIAKGPRFAELRPLLELLDRHSEELPEGWL